MYGGQAHGVGWVFPGCALPGTLATPWSPGYTTGLRTQPGHALASARLPRVHVPHVLEGLAHPGLMVGAHAG